MWLCGFRRNSIPCYTSIILSMFKECRPVFCVENAWKFLKYVAFRPQENRLPRLKTYLKLLYPETIFPEGAHLTC